MNYSKLLQALKWTKIPVAEGGWAGAEDLRQDYIVIALDGAVDLNADNHHGERMLEGSIDLYTYHSRGVQKAQKVEQTLEAHGIIWRLGYGPAYEHDTGFTHWEYIFQCLPG